MKDKSRSWLEGPRWAQAKKFLYDLAIKLDLDITFTDHDKGLINETIYYTIEGESANIAEYHSLVKKAIVSYNKEP